MTFRFQKRIRVGKYGRVNISKKGVGFSLGKPGLRFNVSSKGKPGYSVGVPGTGMSYRSGCVMVLVISVAVILLITSLIL